MRVFFIALTIILACQSTWVGAQGYITISGTVTDENGEPLPAAVVQIKGTTLGVGTNSAGNYNINVHANKPATLLFQHTGYTTIEKTFDAKGNQRTDIQLSPTQNELQEVTVTSSRIERPLKDEPVVTRIITSKEIEALNPMDVSTILQYELPGLQISFNSMSHEPEITYQGMSGEYILFLMDGERISGEGADHNVDFSHFNVDEIERIEVIKGAQSTIYGSNALGGVINIITKKANRPFTGNISAHYGDNNSQKYTVSIGTKQKKFSSLTNATHRRKDTYTIQDDNGQIINSTDSVGNMIQSQRDAYSTTVYGYKIWDFSQKFGYAITDKLNADVKGAFYHNERDRQTGKKFQETYTDYSVLGGLKYLITDKQQLQLSYSFDNYQKDKDFFNANFIRTDYRNKNHIARMVYSATLGKHTLFAGVENNYEYLKHYMLKDSADADANNFAIFAQEDWKICPKVDFVVGVRSDHHELYKWHVTPKLSVMYKPLESWTFRGGYSQGFRSPSLKELYQAYDMGGLGWFMLYGNEDLKPETSHQFTVSAEYAKGSMDISANFHHTRYNDKITYAMMNDGTSDRQYINAENAKTTGLEAIGQYKFDFGMTFCASYAYINDYEEVDGRNTSSVRPHSATFSIRYNKKIRKTGISAALNGHWGSSIKTYSYNSDGTYQWITYDARTMCTLMLGVQLPRGINASIGADNLFNYTDKASDSSVQMPRTGISLSASLNINLADLFGI